MAKTNNQFRDESMLLAIAVKLKALRKKSGLPQREVAKLTGQNIGRMEAAQSNITISSLEKICLFYGISLEDFFDNIENL